VVDLRRYGERAILLTLAGSDDAAAWYEELRASPPDGTVDVVLGARTVLVLFTDRRATDAAMVSVPGRAPAALSQAVAGKVCTGDIVHVPVRYDGADLSHVADRAGLTVTEFITQHSGVEYRVGFVGFAPGFAYLTGLPAPLHCPRRRSPRSSVPAGSVAIAGEYSAVYPAKSPGGWNLIGSTDLAMWDLHRDPPALLQPGMRVRFVERR
jgi:KipI family sensor histidine kinase inhibitor